MSSLKELRNRIASVKSTQKITSAMKMVAASKLRRAQEQAEAARPYSDRMERVLAGLARGAIRSGQGPRLLRGTGSDRIHLVVAITSDRGLCGGFNSSIVRETRRTVTRLRDEGKTVKLYCIGRKGRDALRREFATLIAGDRIEVGRPALTFADAETISTRILDWFADETFDVCTVIYNQFKSAISQVVTAQQLIPLPIPEEDGAAPGPVYEFEPGEEAILAELLPSNLSVQIYKTLLESAASEQGARMAAMDNATRNAGEMIKSLTLVYNRSRQASITKELIEIISGAEAL